MNLRLRFPNHTMKHLQFRFGRSSTNITVERWDEGLKQLVRTQKFIDAQKSKCLNGLKIKVWQGSSNDVKKTRRYQHGLKWFYKIIGTDRYETIYLI